MTILETLAVKLTGLTDEFGKAMSEADKRWEKTKSKFESAGKSMQDVGGKLTLGITAPLLAIGTAATMAATDFNAGMANVASLDVPIARVQELKSNVQDMAISVGKDTGDLADGLYQVVSAFGDTGDTVSILEINAKAAAAGLATTTDAINLTSAVTKGYGDTSAEAVQKAADLAFQTVKLGQTTFPELASSMGKVVPIAAALGVSQEELFGQMATLTGVTGSAAEVGTQLRATYQALLSPTTEMGGAIATVARQLDNQGKLVGGPLVDAWHAATAQHTAAVGAVAKTEAELRKLDTSTKSGADRAKELEKALKGQKKATEESYDAMIKAGSALGPTIVESAGLTDALSLLSDQANGNTDTLSNMFGSVEALTAVLALSGGQSDTFKEKLAAMGDVSGAADKAFKAQTEGINKGGFTMQQVAAKTQVLMQKLGDGLAPALNKVLEIATPWIDKLISMADWFANTDVETQTWIVTLGGLLAAAGPVIGILGTVTSAIGSVIGVVATVSGLIGGAAGLTGLVGGLGTALTVLTGPIGLTVAAVAGLALAWNSDFLGMKTATTGMIDNVKAAWPGFVDGLGEKWRGFTQSLPGLAETGMGAAKQAMELQWGAVKGLFQIQADAVAGVMRAFGWEGIGRDSMEGLARGIRNAAGKVADAAKQAAKDAFNAAKRFLGIGSPSKLYMGLGEDSGEGYEVGWERAAPSISRSVEDSLSDVIARIDTSMASLANGFEPQAAGAGAGPINQTFNFYGPADAEQVRQGAKTGLAEALRQRGIGA